MTAAILVAAGSGERLGAGVPKALVEVAGDSLIGHCLTTLGQVRGIEQIVIVVPASEVTAIRAAVRGATVVPGGATRDDSVRCGLRALADVEHVVIHDAARPFTPAAVFERVMQALAGGAVAVIPGLPVVDTIKQVRDARVVRTVDRSDLVSVQTPQGFRVTELLAAHAARTAPVTDDATLMEHAGHRVQVVPGAAEAFKITTPFDLAVARAMQEQ